jgi:hypothetical protein
MSVKKPAAVKPASKKTARAAATHPTWIEMIKVRVLLSMLCTLSFCTTWGMYPPVIKYGSGRAQGIFFVPKHRTNCVV